MKHPNVLFLGLDGLLLALLIATCGTSTGSSGGGDSGNAIGGYAHRLPDVPGRRVSSPPSLPAIKPESSPLLVMEACFTP